jgi:quinoprotein glucose dehydrogenase
MALAAVGLGAQTVRSTWDGVYTQAQADRGKGIYAHECLECHGADLEGDPENPPLTEPAFVYKWNTLSAADLFERIHRDMPMDRPGTLTRQRAADLVAFLLNFNKFPTGARELPADTAALRQIRIDATPPGSGESHPLSKNQGL